MGKVPEASQVEEKESKIEGTVKLYERRSFVSRLNEIALLPNNIIDSTLTHLYIRRILNIGDSGLHNMLLVEQKGCPNA